MLKGSSVVAHAHACEYGLRVQEHLPSTASHAELTTNKCSVSMTCTPSNLKPDLQSGRKIQDTACIEIHSDVMQDKKVNTRLLCGQLKF